MWSYLLVALSGLFLASDLIAGEVFRFSVYSNAMDREIPNAVIVPDDYNENNSSYPVVYLLHGAGADFRQWIGTAPFLVEYVDRYDVIIICPDGGSTSWYFDSPIDPQVQYETYVATELVGYVDTNFRTIANASGRAISGLSMGGHGALFLAIRHQDTWGAAGSTSGGLDFTPFPEYWDIALRLGPYHENRDRWESYTVTSMTDLLDGSSLQIIFDCGTDDFFYEVNNTFHQKLIECGFEHEYIEQPGGHTGDYWAHSIKRHLEFFDEFFGS